MTWDELYEQCRICDKCPLGKTKTNTVFGCGNQSARLMFVGEAPGEQEDKEGIPFVGAAGKLLDKYLDAVGILRDEVYIANILKCRPPHNRDPLPEEGDACIGFLREQVKLIRPEIIVCLGRISAMRLIKPDRIQKSHRIRIIGQANADETATDGIKPCETVRRTVRRNFSFPVTTKKSPSA